MSNDQQGGSQQQPAPQPQPDVPQPADPYGMALIQSVTRQRDEQANKAAELEARVTVYTDLNQRLQRIVALQQQRIKELEGSAAKVEEDAKDTHPLGGVPGAKARARANQRR